MRTVYTHPPPHTAEGIDASLVQEWLNLFAELEKLHARIAAERCQPYQPTPLEQQRAAAIRAAASGLHPSDLRHGGTLWPNGFSELAHKPGRCP